jgi:hypothetical protein
MNYTIYKTTNLVNGKYYIGKHITKDPYDSYLGSGERLQYALKKYGKHNFIKDVLYIFDEEWKMELAERILVVVDRETNYNIARGGQGGCIVLHKSHPLYEQTCKKISKSLNEMFANTTKEERQEKYSLGDFHVGRKRSEDTKRKMSAASKLVDRSYMIGRSVSVETRTKLSNANKGKKRSAEHKKNISSNHHDVSGINNPMFGRKHSDHAKKLASEKAKNRKRIICDYCHKDCDASNHARWHGEKCKKKRL